MDFSFVDYILNMKEKNKKKESIPEDNESDLQVTANMENEEKINEDYQKGI